MTDKEKQQEMAIDAGLRAWFHRARWAYVEANKESLRKDFERAVKAYLDIINDGKVK